jgi:hypothetical protein
MLMMVRKKNFFVGLSLMFITSLIGSSIFAQVKELSPLAQALSSRHPDFDIPSLISIAGTEDSLINELMELRLKDKPGNLSINSEKILLEFAHREDVKAALLEDVAAKDRFGLASLILSRIDTFSDETFRHSIAKQALRRTKSLDEAQSKRFKLLLKSSTDPLIKSMGN